MVFSPVFNLWAVNLSFRYLLRQVYLCMYIYVFFFLNRAWIDLIMFLYHECWRLRFLILIDCIRRILISGLLLIWIGEIWGSQFLSVCWIRHPHLIKKMGSCWFFVVRGRFQLFINLNHSRFSDVIFLFTGSGLWFILILSYIAGYFFLGLDKLPFWIESKESARFVLNL